MLSFANIKKTKGHAVSIFLMFIIASLLLNLGLLVFVNFGGYFNKITKELKSSDVYYLMPKILYSEKIDKYIKDNSNIKDIQMENPLWAPGTVPYNNGTKACVFLINDMDKDRSLSKWKLVGESLPTDSMSIYIPYVMSIDGGYRLNDKFEVNFDDKVITFTVKGFTEDAFFSSLDTGVMGVYMPHGTYERVREILGDKYDAALIYANLKNQNKDVENGIRGFIRQDNPNINADATGTLLSLDLEIVKLSRSLIASGVSVMMIAFAAIIAVVCLVVVRFRIGNSIEEDMTKIGSLKAVGYTCRQIRLSIAAQFSMIALIGSIVGISLSLLATPVLSDVFAHQSGLKWVQGFDGAIGSISLFVILFAVALVSFMASRRIKRLNPIVALRGGIVTHNFRKNRMPLHKSKGSLPVVLALKLMLQNMRQSIMIGIIFIVVSFACAFAFVMFYNSVVDTKTFAEVPGTEISNAIAILDPKDDNTSLVQDIKNLKDVRKAQFLDTTKVKSGSYEVYAFVMDDYSQKETNTVYEGRYPLHSNEAAVSGYLAKKLNKVIGDSITLNVDDRQAEYIITGFSQGSYMGGLSIVSIRHDGILKLNPDFKQQSLQIYLNKGAKSAEFKEKIEGLYGDTIPEVIDMDKEFQQGMGLYTSVVSKVGVVIMVVMILVVILVLYFVMNSSIIRKKHELGIQKALGFTTLQLMNQISIGFLPPIVTGVILGSLLGMTQTNAIMTVVQGVMGIMRANYIITPLWIALLGVAIVLVSYTISMLITYRIRKISAYGMVSE